MTLLSRKEYKGMESIKGQLWKVALIDIKKWACANREYSCHRTFTLAIPPPAWKLLEIHRICLLTDFIVHLQIYFLAEISLDNLS